jgi:hypothetical protein
VFLSSTSLHEVPLQHYSFSLSLKLHDDGNNERKWGEKKEVLMMTTRKKYEKRKGYRWE